MTSNNESLIPALRSGAGCVLFLPGLNYKNSDKLLCENRNCRRGCHLEKEGYNHPIVVLAITTKGAAGIASSKSDIQFVQVSVLLIQLSVVKADMLHSSQARSALRMNI